MSSTTYLAKALVLISVLRIRAEFDQDKVTSISHSAEHSITKRGRPRLNNCLIGSGSEILENTWAELFLRWWSRIVWSDEERIDLLDDVNDMHCYTFLPSLIIMLPFFLSSTLSKNSKGMMPASSPLLKTTPFLLCQNFSPALSALSMSR